MLQIHIAGHCRGKLAKSEWSVLHWKNYLGVSWGQKNQAKNCNSSAGPCLHNLLLRCKTFLLHNYARGMYYLLISVTESSLSVIPARVGSLLRVCWWLLVFCIKSVIFARQREKYRNSWSVKWVFLTMEGNEKEKTQRKAVHLSTENKVIE